MNLIPAPRPSASVKTSAARLLAAIAGLSLAAAPAAYAANTTWVGNTDANFSTLANWNTLTPNANTPIFGVAGSSGTTLNNDLSGATYIGLTYNSGASAFTIGGNSFTLTGNIVNNSTSTQTINTPIVISGARTLNAASGQLVFGGNLTGSPGTTTLTPTNKITLSGTNSLTMQANFGGFLVNGAGGVDITGATTISGAAGNTFSGYMNVNGNTTLTVQSGGSLTINGTSNGSKPDSGIANNVTGTSTILVNGGSLTYSAEQGIMLGNNRSDATGVLTISSGTATINAGGTIATDIRSYVAMGRDSGHGIINLNGGTLATGRNFVLDGSAGLGQAGFQGPGSATFNFNGGTLKALANQTDWLNSATINTNQKALTSVTTTSAASTIDSNGFSVAINNVISGAGGFNINSSTGAGTVTFGGANTYTGATKVNSGTFALGAAGSISNSSGIEIATGATFNTSAQSFTMLGGQTVTFGLDGGGAGSAGLFQAGALNISAGSVSFNLTGGALDDAAYVLANYSSISGTAFATVNNLPTGYALDYNYLGGNQIALVAIPEPSSFAALVGLTGLGLAASRRRRAAARSL